jgi:hypothetical protein
MTTLVKSILTIASFTVTLAWHASEKPDEVNDAITLLQAGVLMEQEIRSSSPNDLDDAPVDASKACESFSAGYQPVGDFTCGNKAPQMQAPIVEQKVVAPSPVEESIIAAPSNSEANMEDPPGAYTLKVLLELGIIVLVLDGMRRWRLQQQEAQQQIKASEALLEQEAAADRAWAEMVKAAAIGDVPSFKKALQHSPPIKREDAWGCTPLHFAATGGSTEVTMELLDLGAEVDAVDACDETALHFAARAGHAGVCKALLDKGANINAKNAQDMTPLVMAGHAKQAAACRLLAERGASAGGVSDEDLPMLVVSELVRKVVENPPDDA